MPYDWGETGVRAARVATCSSQQFALLTLADFHALR
jgi:hypothetical protein